jgi:hypothetical protein
MFCANCGAEVNLGAAVCLKCGFLIDGSTENDKPNTGFAVLGFLFPIVGLNLYLIWYDGTPKKAKSCGRGALIGLCAEVAITVGIICFITLGVVGFNIADKNKTAVVQDEINATIRPL